MQRLQSKKKQQKQSVNLRMPWTWDMMQNESMTMTKWRSSLTLLLPCARMMKRPNKNTKRHSVRKQNCQFSRIIIKKRFNKQKPHTMRTTTKLQNSKQRKLLVLCRTQKRHYVSKRTQFVELRVRKNSKDTLIVPICLLHKKHTLRLFKNSKRLNFSMLIIRILLSARLESKKNSKLLIAE